MIPHGAVLWINSIRPSLFGGIKPSDALWFWNDDICVYWSDGRVIPVSPQVAAAISSGQRHD